MDRKTLNEAKPIIPVIGFVLLRESLVLIVKLTTNLFSVGHGVQRALLVDPGEEDNRHCDGIPRGWAT